LEKAKEQLKKNDIKEGKERFRKVREQMPSREELLKNFNLIEEKPKSPSNYLGNIFEPQG